MAGRWNDCQVYLLYIVIMEKKEKKGFWASLFGKKSCGCGCGCGEFVVPSEALPSGVGEASAPKGGAVKEVLVLGTGCAKCKATFATLERVVDECCPGVKLSKVEDLEEIMRYQVMATPAVVVDGRVVMKGRVPSESEARQLLGVK